jgi:methylated-DNA-protein-cysteine methyltransferase-like protein
LIVLPAQGIRLSRGRALRTPALQCHCREDHVAASRSEWCTILVVGQKRADASRLSTFDLAVKRVVAAIPRGSVLAYGEVALLAGRPGGARAVVRALYRVKDVPWWRVVRANRTLAPEIAARQARRLRAEGVRIDGRRIVGPAARGTRKRRRRGRPRAAERR